MSESKSSACILCECNCGIQVHLGGADGRRLVKVRGDDAHPASRGYACEKPSRLDFERVSAEFPLVLSAGERRSFTANTIIRNPEWRRKDRAGALRMHPDDAQRAGVADGGRVRLSTRRGSAEVSVEDSVRMHPGHISLPNGLGLDSPEASGGRVATGVSPNELTRSEDRDWVAGTPWHKHTPARVEAL